MIRLGKHYPAGKQLIRVQPELGQVLFGLGFFLVGRDLVAERPDTDAEKLGRLGAIVPRLGERPNDVILLDI